MPRWSNGRVTDPVARSTPHWESFVKVSPRRSIRLALVASAAVGALVLSACGSSTDSGSSSSSTAPAASGASSASGSAAPASGGADVDAAKAALVDPTALTVCTSLSYKPFQFTDGDQVVGFDVDLLDLAAAKLGVEQKIIDTPFE